MGQNHPTKTPERQLLVLGYGCSPKLDSVGNEARDLERSALESNSGHCTTAIATQASAHTDFELETPKAVKRPEP